MWFIFYIILLLTPSFINSISVQIDGIIDLGPNWNFKYSIAPLPEHTKPTIPTSPIFQTRPVTRENLTHSELTSNLEHTTRHSKKKFFNKHGKYVKLKENIYDDGKQKKLNQPANQQSAVKDNSNQISKEATEKNVTNEYIRSTQGYIEEMTTRKRRKHKQRPKSTEEIEGSEFKKFTDANTTEEDECSYERAHKKLVTDDDKITTRIQKDIYTATQYYNHKTVSHIYIEEHKVKEDAGIKQFTSHLLRQGIQVFNAIKSKVTDEPTRNRVDDLSNSYQQKFTQFVEKAENRKILTRLGTQKVVLHTIGTSNTLLRRLVNHLKGHVAKKGIIRNGLEDVIENEMNKEIQSEYKHACTKFNICRSAKGYVDFLAEILGECLKNSDTKLRQAMDAFTEVLKNSDLTPVVDSDLNKRLKRGILLMETWDDVELRFMTTAFKNLLQLRNMPLVISSDGATSSVVNKTVALMEVIDILDDKIQPTDDTVLSWNNLKTSLGEWTKGKRADVLQIMQALVTQLLDKGIYQLDMAEAHSVNEKLRTIIKDVYVSYLIK